MIRTIAGAVLIFSAALSWQCGHFAAFNAPTILPSYTATSA